MDKLNHIRPDCPSGPELEIRGHLLQCIVESLCIPSRIIGESSNYSSAKLEFYNFCQLAGVEPRSPQVYGPLVIAGTVHHENHGRYGVTR